MYDLILKNCNIVNENHIRESDIAIKDSRIELIANSINSEADFSFKSCNFNSFIGMPIKIKRNFILIK